MGVTGLVLSGAEAQTLRRSARIVVGFIPGSTSDLIARAIADAIRDQYASIVVVENRDGAGGRIAVDFVRRSTSSGQTILQTPASILTIQPHLFPNKITYDFRRDLVPVASICRFDFAVAVPLNSPIRTLDDLAMWSRARAGLNWASPALGSMPYLVGLEIGRALQLSLNYIPYRGSSLALQDLVAGRLDFFVGILGDVIPRHSKDLRIITISSRNRNSLLSDVPTFEELGYSDMSKSEWFGLFLPAGAPQFAVDDLFFAVKRAIFAPELNSLFSRLHMEIDVSDSSADFALRVQDEYQRWEQYTKIRSLQVD